MAKNYIAISAIEVGSGDERREISPGDVVQGLAAEAVAKLESKGIVREASEAEDALFERREASKKAAPKKVAGKEELA
jgi:hypothetical protein